MDKNITVILVKASWCGFCKKFIKIYDKARDIHKSIKFFDNYNLIFEDYDFANNDVEKLFSINHNNIINDIEGYPTIFIKLNNKNKNTYHKIESTLVDPNININNQENEAAKRFLENIINCIKTLESDNASLFIQQGGTKSPNNSIDYYNKYLKYKSKYIKLKKI